MLAAFSIPIKRYFESLCVRINSLIFAPQTSIDNLILEKLRRIMRYFLPLLFLTYWGGITLFTHSHVVNGVIIVHSHPFKAGHQHTQEQAETVFFLGHYAASALPALLSAVFCFLALLGVLAVPRVVRLVLSHPEDGVRLRAPPVCVF